jgi:hypothetical protein
MKRSFKVLVSNSELPVPSFQPPAFLFRREFVEEKLLTRAKGTGKGR